MNSLSTAATFNAVISACWSPRAHHRYVDLFRDLMTAEKITIRTLSLKTGLSKSRVGLLLHPDIEQRPEMFLHEFHRLLSAFDLDEMEAIVLVNTYQNMGLARNARFRGLLSLLALVFTELPPTLLRRIELITGFDGSEVRRSWKDHIMNLVCDKLSEGVCELITRRESLFDYDHELAKRLGTAS